MSDEIVNAALAFERARTRLLRRIAAQCPGPHQFVQHRDRRPPWCNACRYTADGLKVANTG